MAKLFADIDAKGYESSEPSDTLRAQIATANIRRSIRLGDREALASVAVNAALAVLHEQDVIDDTRAVQAVVGAVRMALGFRPIETPDTASQATEASNG